LTEQDVDVEALVQDTFEQALHVWDIIKVPRAWLYTVARRRLSRCIPAAALRADGDPTDHSEQGAVSWTTVAPAVSTEDFVTAREVIKLIQLMPQQRRQEVAYLRYLEEWGFNEIAEQLGCCPSTARVHALQARAHIAAASRGATVYQAGRDMSIPCRASGGHTSGRGWLALPLVLSGILAVLFLGWSWALVAVGGVATVALVVRAWGSRHARWRGASAAGAPQSALKGGGADTAAGAD
jgi:RNA polymerase sigma-70 factor (ECF subfamily)